MYNRNHVYEPGEWLLLRRDVSSTKNKQTVNKPLSHVSQTHVNYTRCFSCDISPKNDVLKSRSLRRRTCILCFFFVCFYLLCIISDSMKTLLLLLYYCTIPQWAKNGKK